MTSARATIVIPSYNHAPYLRSAIQSALSQTEPRTEIIVIDDHSEDDSVAVARSFCDERVRVIANETRLGIARNYQACLAAGNAPYLKILCSDDSLHPECVEALSRALDSNPGAVIATSDREEVDDAGGVRIVRLRLPIGRAVSGREIVRRSFLALNVIGGPSNVLLRRSGLPPSGFDLRMKQMLDLDLWLRMLRAGTLIYVPRVLSTFRRHRLSATTSHAASAEAARDLLWMSTSVSNGEYYPRVTTFERKRLQAMCLARSVRGIASAIAQRDPEARRSCASLAQDAFWALISSAPAI